MDSYSHPILRGDYPDPSVLKDGSDYWMTHSSFNYAPGLLIWHSRNLVDWEPVAHALPRYDGDVWAPEIIRHDGRYFIYYKTTTGNHVVWADAIHGPWSEPVDLDVGYIDPGHITAPDGRRFLHLSKGVMVELTPDGLGRKGEPRKVFDAWPIPEDRAVEGVCLEAPKLFWRNGWCHMLVAEGGTSGPATSHMVVHARSRNVDGPWEYSPHNPVIATASRNERWWSRGHGTLVEGPDGEWYCVYHAYEKDFHTLGRQTLMERVVWTEDDWFTLQVDRVADGPMRAPAPRHASTSAVDEWQDDFCGPELNWRWRFWGTDGHGRYRFLPGGGIEMDACGDSIGSSAPMTCIAEHRRYAVEVDVELRDGAAGGLVLFYNNECSGGLMVDGCEISTPRGKLLRAPGLDFPWKRMRLKLVNDANEVQLWMRPEGGEWERHRKTMEVSSWNHNAFGGFLSLRPALLSVGDKGSVVYRNFTYRALADGA